MFACPSRFVAAASFAFLAPSAIAQIATDSSWRLRTGSALSPIFGVAIPAGYREWTLVAPSQEAGGLDELRAILGNASSMAAYRSGGRCPYRTASCL